MSGISNIPRPRNEPVLSYAPDSPERAALKAALKSQASQQVDIPVVVGGQEVRGGNTHDVVSPHCHQRVLAGFTTPIPPRSRRPFGRRSKPSATGPTGVSRTGPRSSSAPRICSPGTRRQLLNAATMLGQSKTAFQAEIDSACELIDFLRFNVAFAERIYQEQPESVPGAWNRMDHRPLEGFVYAITPFNFTAIGGNLPTAPALMGNAVVWKPSSTAALSNWHFFRLLQDAGLPPGVINFVPGDAVEVSRVLLNDPDFAGIHFTGSTAVFQSLWKTIGENMARYRGYPRIVGETGGKDFILAHASADPEALAVGMVRGAYEYQGQKCSAASRAYIPDTLWPEVRDRVVAMIGRDPDGRRRGLPQLHGRGDRWSRLRAAARPPRAGQERSRREVLAGGGTDDSVGWFVEPTLLQASDPDYQLMCEELFGPVLTTYVYPAAKWRRRWRWWTGPGRTRSPARCGRGIAAPWPKPTGRSGSRRATTT